jgi:hypothetical protein
VGKLGPRRPWRGPGGTRFPARNLTSATSLPVLEREWSNIWRLLLKKTAAAGRQHLSWISPGWRAGLGRHHRVLHVGQLQEPHRRGPACCERDTERQEAIANPNLIL